MRRSDADSRSSRPGPHTPLSLELLELEDPATGEILVRVVATGVCHTDLVVRDGMLPTPQPVVLGHEGAGVVERVGESVTKVAPGDHVVMTFNSCGDCANCADGAETYCFDFFAHNFAATALTARRRSRTARTDPQQLLRPIVLRHPRAVPRAQRSQGPTDVPLELLGPLACGVQTGAGAVMNALGVTPAIVRGLRRGIGRPVGGDGRQLVGAAPIIAVDLDQDRLAFAETVGATHTINSGQVNATEEILKITGSGLHFALDTTGLGP